MTQAIAIEKLTLQAVKQKFGLRQSTDDNFFWEWQTSLPTLSDSEQERLERIRAVYRNLGEQSVLESTVNLTIVAPLLDLAELFLPPFRVETETQVEVVAADGETVIRGRLDVVIIQGLIWVLTIESKRAGFSLIVGIPQVLAYMLAAPTAQNTLYGMVTNGRNFIFVKLNRESDPVYALSQELIIDRDTDLAQTLKITKALAGIAAKIPPSIN
ncbi:MAG: restriction endonuclease subunit R [Phormidesmis sp.]